MYLIECVRTEFFSNKTVFAEHRITPLFMALTRKEISADLLFLLFDCVEYVKFEIKRDASVGDMFYRYMLCYDSQIPVQHVSE